MKKTVGLQTPHYAPNYGAKLQAFAIAEAIRALDYEVEYINRRPQKAAMIKNSISRYLKKKEEVAYKELADFEKVYLQPQTVAIYNNDDFSQLDVSKYYAIVVGSDQMWRDDYYHAGFELTPYLFYAEDACVKRVAYAVSFGKRTCSHPEGRRAEIERLIHKFDAISVREKTGVDILRDVFHSDGVWVCDPTLLHDANFYKQKFGLQESKEEYRQITTYILDQSKCFFKCAKQIATMANMPLHHIMECRKSDILYKRPFSRLPFLKKKPSIQEWLDQILNSKYIVTDSYHGMLFSIIFRKQFVVFNRTAGGSERYHSIMGKLGLEERLFNEGDNIGNIVDMLEKRIDWDTVYAEIESFKRYSYQFLTDALS